MSDPIKNNAGRATKGYPVDDRMLFWTDTEYRPYADAAEVIANIIAGRRYKGLMVVIGKVLYWFKNGVTDDDLVPFIPSGTIPIKVDGVSGSPVVDLYTYQNDDLIGKVVNHILVNKQPETAIDEDFTFDTEAGEITRVQQWQPLDTSLIFFE